MTDTIIGALNMLQRLGYVTTKCYVRRLVLWTNKVTTNLPFSRRTLPILCTIRHKRTIFKLDCARSVRRISPPQCYYTGRDRQVRYNHNQKLRDVGYSQELLSKGVQNTGLPHILHHSSSSESSQSKEGGGVPTILQNFLIGLWKSYWSL